ncbi:response regulator transcription factor [Blastococcus sp. CT_GayMR20]|uniref:response regulator transcription factor n=1 Tax=Blastococcus sp. CT_GayMR20 TaxID=2559609 RepID=UPI001073B4E5|nr:response regulator transcription factor [Blastococcus sp. CT_GayMR20]TFV92065.1 response regulator transcription factor [Blastococcus sp. CT_GayMR20]
MRVVIADDTMLTRQGIAGVLADCGIDVVAAVGDPESLIREVDRTRPDAAVVDIRMPPMHTDEGIRATARLRGAHPALGVLLLSAYVEPEYAVRLLEDHPGGIGYLLKDRVSDGVLLVDALRRLCDGETVVDPTIVSRVFERRRRVDPLAQLSDREREVLGLLTEGLSNRALAARLYVTERTVEAHITSIFGKLGLVDGPGVHRRVLAVLTYLRA